MGVVHRTIIVENRFSEMFDYLPALLDADDNPHNIVFEFGDQKELLAFLKESEGQSEPYPLIWLQYPYEENHQKTRVEIKNMVLVFAVKTNVEMFNRERFETTFGEVLFPLLDNVKKLFRLANIIDTDNTYRMVKFPNYSATEEGDEQVVFDTWDALKITFDCTINNWCLTPIKI